MKVFKMAIELMISLDKGISISDLESLKKDIEERTGSDISIEEVSEGINYILNNRVGGGK